MAEWSEFAISIDGDDRSEDAALLKNVYHIVHAKICRRILEDEYLRGGLVRDKSVLNKSRICVTWLSANYWHQGSLYGNVRFTFDWNSLVEDRRVYWVEVINYPNPAYRLLITDRDMSGSRYVKPYDAKVDKGPLRKKGETWYWNRKFTSEFMIEGDIGLVEADKLDFVEHSECKEMHTDCPDIKKGKGRVAGEVIAFILGNAIHCVDDLLRSGEGLTMGAEQGITAIGHDLSWKSDCFGGKLAKPKSGVAIVRGALALYGSGQLQAAREVVRMLRTKDVFDHALEQIVRSHLGTKSWQVGV